MSRGIDKVLDVKWWALFVVAMAILVLIFTQGAALCAAKADAVDINSATQAELEAVKAGYAANRTILLDNLPDAGLAYGTPSVSNIGAGVTGGDNVTCSVTTGPCRKPIRQREAVPRAATPRPRAAGTV